MRNVGVTRGWLMMGVCVLVLADFSAVAQDGREVNLDDLATQYEQALFKLTSEQSRKMAKLDEAYTNGLARLAGRARAQGDLDSLLVLKKESERFARERYVPDGALAEKPAQLRELQESYQKTSVKNYLAESQGLVEVADRYLQVLDHLQRQHTVRGEIEKALAMRRAREQIVNSVVYSKAKSCVDVLGDAGEE